MAIGFDASGTWKSIPVGLVQTENRLEYPGDFHSPEKTLLAREV